MSEQIEALLPIAFFTTAALLVVLERFAVLTRQRVAIGRRTFGNIGLFAVGTVASSLFIPAGIYAFAAGQPPGLVSGSGLPAAVQWLLTFLLLDLWQYGLHRLFHRSSLLWRLHLVHHSDTQIDVTTTERHHPVDLLLSTALVMALIAVFGLPAPAVGLYLLAATVLGLWSHANLRLPERLDRALRRWIVTPSAHVIHHSAWQMQTDSNYGMVLTLWDRLFGTWRDPAGNQVKRFGLDYFRGPPHAGLGSLLVQPFAYRSADGHDDGPAAKTEEPGSPPPAVAAVSVAMASTWVEMAAGWSRSEAYLWCWLVIPLMAYLLGWVQRPAILARAPEPGLSGVVLSVLAAVMGWLSDLMNVNVGRELALVLALQGVALSMLGWQAYRAMFPMLALMFFMVPSADWLQPLLRALTVDAIEWFASAANLPHRIDGYILQIGERRYVVVDDCSGLSYVTLAMFLGYSFGLLLYRSLYKVVALAAVGALLGVLCNVVRVNAIVWIDWLRGTQMDLAAHGDIQWIAMFATLALLLLLLSLLRGDGPWPAEDKLPSGDRPAARQTAMPRSWRASAPAIAGGSVLLVGLVANAALLSTTAFSRGAEGTFLSRRYAEPPVSLTAWSRVPGALAWKADHAAQTESLQLEYRRDGHGLQVIVQEAVAADVKLPAPQGLRQSGATWHEVHSRREEWCTGSVCTSFRRVVWQREKTRQRREVVWAYCTGPLITDSTLALRARHAWHRVSGHPLDRRSIALVFDGDNAERSEVALMLRQVHQAFEASAQ